MGHLRPEPRLFLATCGRSFLAEQLTRGQAVHERDCSQYRKAGGDDGMHDEHQPMPGRCIRAFDGELECPPGVRAYARRAALLSTHQQLMGFPV